MKFRKTLTLLMLAMGLVFALSAWAQQKPLTRDQVQGLVRDGLGDESGVKLIEQRGIDFAPAEDFLQSLKATGASEAFLKALHAAKQPEPASAKKPLHQVQILALVAGEVPSHRVAVLVNERGIDFEPHDDYLHEVRLGGGDDELITALKNAKVTKPATVDPTAQARQAEVQQHVARGAGLLQKNQYADAEVEYRAAVRLDPENADLHHNLGVALEREHDLDGAIAEYREAVRLNPNYELPHLGLGNSLLGKGDPDGAITEYREAVRLNPNLADAHHSLGAGLERKGDMDGAIAEYREALRLNPNFADAHHSLGATLERKGDMDGAIAEYRETLRLNPNYDLPHLGLGNALLSKGDLDGAIAQYREALRLNPNLADAHHNLGVALERKGDRPGALVEYREAYTLAPKNAQFKQDYEHLLR